MPINRETLVTLFEASLTAFLSEEAESIQNNLGETHLTGCLVMRIRDLRGQFELNEYFADPEYNRKQEGRIKTMMGNNHQIIPIRPDLILHSRGKFIQDDNLIVIEMKKSNRPRDEKDKDRLRLQILTQQTYDDIWIIGNDSHPEHVCGYKLGVYIELINGTRSCIIEYYADGALYNRMIKEY
ncbi:hypothetical protein [Chitinophaga sp. CF418]|uniref:hypothetical protein n=1 Tax=Chitinophaga sp. CF418 TaxID=1855287 RepID=UPI00091F7543|nr:hypothetical protein [Chitinophaga sp. CF418]SHN45510.1 hypothetical protein SAMN05216311_12083 [Chitinophaga sp. CF418]